MRCTQQQVRHDSTMLGSAAAAAVKNWRNQTGLCTVASCSRRCTWSSTMLLWSKPPRSGEVLYPRSSAMDGSLQAGMRSSRSSIAECMPSKHLCSDVQQGSQQPCAQWATSGVRDSEPAHLVSTALLARLIAASSGSCNDAPWPQSAMKSCLLWVDTDHMTHHVRSKHCHMGCSAV